ncbi:hypothetical protein [Microlunatus speluncae]|uniref:hypothetical protein n=1 Tax=Microlunatus speluncae TaxID=2594267 RepID=UPI0012663A39|nr:hypothetical protein [Microlunatus speluncae]
MITEPRQQGAWIRPSDRFPAEPRWGFADGIQVGIVPPGGPRGLLRIYAPYLDHPRQRLINFIAIEPIPEGQDKRGYSELEPSGLDQVRGKRFWSATGVDAEVGESDQPVAGELTTVDGVERLSVVIISERFDNGADVAVRVTFRADRPHEFGIAAFRRSGSVPLSACVLTATMGNFARLRLLELANRTVTPADCWSGFTGTGFAPHAKFGLAELTRTETGDAVVSARPDEVDHGAASYAADTAEHWKYFGRRAVQTWRAADPDPGLVACVNGRYTYWASESPIPGGVSYENFELIEPFRPGREFFFAVEPID